MKRSIIYLALGFLTLGCTNLEIDEVKSSSVQFPDEYQAYTDSETQTKVFVNGSLKTLWNKDDRITIFNDTYNAQWKFNGETGADNGSFTEVQGGSHQASAIPTTYAVYPYNPSTSITTEGVITLSLPSVQHYALNSYGLGANTMVAATKTLGSDELHFKNLCSYVVIQLYGTGTVKSITLTGNNGEKLAGAATVTPVYGETPSVSMSDAATTSIRLDCGEGVALGSTEGTATEFWFCIPPTTFSKGFTIKAVRTDGYFMEKVTSSKKVFERNTKYAMAAIEGVFDQLETPEYVPFEDANFKAYCVQNFDTDGDGEISIEEAEKVESITVDGADVKSLGGIEYFTKLKSLDCYLKHSSMQYNQYGELHWYDSNNNEVFGQLTSLDLSKNTALTSLDCSGNPLTSLDLSMNTALTVLYCDGNQLTSLDLSKNTALTSLDCQNNKLTSLDVSKNTALKHLECYHDKLTSLDLSNNTALTYLDCQMNQLTSLDLSNNTALTYLNCQMNQLTSLDLNKNTALKFLDCCYNQLTSLDVSKNTALTELYCCSNQLTSLDASVCIALTELNCGFNSLKSLNVSNNTALTYLYCQMNQLTSLDVSKNTALTYLDCMGNQLTSLDISKNTALKFLTCYNNQISTIYVWEGFDPSKTYINKDDSASFVVKTDYVPFEDANFKAYCVKNFDKDGDGEISIEEAEKVITVKINEYSDPFQKTEDFDVVSTITTIKGVEYFKNLREFSFSCDWYDYSYQLIASSLEEADFSKNTSLTILRISNTSLASLDLSKNSALTQLVCNNNQLTSLDVSNNTALTELICGGNPLGILDLSKNSALTQLVCNNNQLTSLDVSNNTALTELICGGNPLGILDLSKNSALTQLVCNNNQLTRLDVSKNTHLDQLSCNVNLLTSLDLSMNPALKELQCYSNRLTSLDVSGCTAMATLQCNNNQLTSLDVSKNTALTSLYCGNNKLTSLDVSGCTAMDTLQCYNNQLTNLDVSKNTALIRLDCLNNQLASLDVSKNTYLSSLGCSDNQLTSLDVSNNTALTLLNCQDNQLTSLDVSKNTALQYLSCNNNQISTIYVWEGFDPSKLFIVEKDDSASFVVKTEE